MNPSTKCKYNERILAKIIDNGYAKFKQRTIIVIIYSGNPSFQFHFDFSDISMFIGGQIQLKVQMN